MISIQDLLSTSYLYQLLGIHCIIGITAAIVAQQKGYKLGKWLIYGLIGGTISLVWALTLKKTIDN